jgi:hypothetical protein
VFAGTVSHGDVPGYYALADVALNYLGEREANRFRASIKTREALAASVPVVTSDTPDGERFARFVRIAAGGPDEFVRGLLEELARPDRERARAGAAWLREQGTYEVAIRSLAEHWEEKLAP